ncbi:MAG: hypothetical protein Q9196_000287 [Gyalolechia fulgens]
MAKSSQRKIKGTWKSATTPNDHISDPRFANIQSDARFRLPSKKNSHVQIDKRFERMLRDETFSSRATVDRYGRRLPKEAGKKELERYYRINKDQERPVEDTEVELGLEKANAKLSEEELSSSAEASSSEEDDDLDVADEEDVFGLLDGPDPNGEGIPVGEVTSRLAVLNLDWDNIRAEDLMAVFSSFVQNAGQIKIVSVYPSAFGRERMEKEEMEGPPKEIFTGRKDKTSTERRNPNHAEADDEDDEVSSAEEDENIKESLLQEDTGQDFDSAKLRRYQLERLRYYYAVLVCSSSSVAQKIYEVVDGTEYLTTANFFDLRFVPDDVSFSTDKPRDECTRIPDGYRPNEFVTDALQHSKVRLTWDAEDGTRKEVQKRAFAASRANIDQNDLKAYLGSDTSDDEKDAPEPVVVDATADNIPSDEQSRDPVVESASRLSKKEAERQRMRALLGLDAEPTTDSTMIREFKSDQSAPVGEMQITFTSGLTSSEHNNSVFTNPPNDHQETTVEKYVRKEKERKARRKSKLKALHEGGGDDRGAPANAPPSLGNDPPYEDRQRNETQPDLGFSDPFFANPDSTNPTAPKTAAENKEAKRLAKSQRAADEAASAARLAELELLTMPDHVNDGDPAHENGIQHFNMKEILRAERAIAKSKKSKRKNGKANEREKEAWRLKESDKFTVDVDDPRFGAVFDRPEFAIDPSHPRFLGTGGMREILEEGRRKRVRKDGEDGDGRLERKKRERNEENGGGEEDVGRLLERIKGKSQKRDV